MRHKRTLLGLLVVLIIPAMALSADAADGPPTAPGAGKNRSASAVDDGAIEGRFVAVAPCRAVDTKVAGGNFASGQFKSFKAKGGTSFASQGGSASGCKVPVSAVAIQATMTAVAKGSGYISAYAEGSTEPATSFMNKSSAANLAVGGIIPVSGAIGSNNFRLHNVGSASRVIVDITGYIVKPLIAQISANGNKVNGTSPRVLSSNYSSSTATGGFYYIQFDRRIDGCSSQVTLVNAPSQVLIYTGGGFPGGDTLVVGLYNFATTTLVSAPFMVTVDC